MARESSRTASTAPLTVDVFMPLMVRDWLTGGATFTMSNRQRGAFVQLLAHAWLQDASLPDDLDALKKYADEPGVWLESEEGAAVLAQFPVVDDLDDPAVGRRRNAKQWELYCDAMERREKAHRAGKTGAAARWGRAGKGEPAPATDRGTTPPSGGNTSGSGAPPRERERVAASAAPVIARALELYPSVAGFVGAAAENRAALERAVGRVADRLDPASVPGFLALVNNALEGMDGPRRTPAEVRSGLEDWCDNMADLTKHSLRAYLGGARRQQPSGSGRGRATPGARGNYVTAKNAPILTAE